jgi:curved DNA-binding protein CbpA
VRRVHKTLAVQHHPDKGGDPEMMTRLNNARDLLLQPEMSDIVAS